MKLQDITPAMVADHISKGYTYRVMYTTLDDVDMAQYFTLQSDATHYLAILHRLGLRASVQWYDANKGWLESYR